MAINVANLKWYYSGGSSNDDPSLSIGGAVSSVALSATALNALFDNVSGQECVDGRTEYRCLYFKNIDSDADGLIDPMLWVVDQPDGSTFQVGLSYQGKNAVATAIVNDTTAPANVSFGNPATKAAGYALPGDPYMQNDYIGVWFKRIIPPNADTAITDGAQWAIEGETV